MPLVCATWGASLGTSSPGGCNRPWWSAPWPSRPMPSRGCGQPCLKGAIPKRCAVACTGFTQRSWLISDCHQHCSQRIGRPSSPLQRRGCGLPADDAGYDALVGFGERFSTRIVHAPLDRDWAARAVVVGLGPRANGCGTPRGESGPGQDGKPHQGASRKGRRPGFAHARLCRGHA